MIGHAAPIKRRFNLDVVTEGVLDGLSLPILIGVGGPGDVIAKNISVERPTRVLVRLPEICVSVRIPFGSRGRNRRGRRGSLGDI
jgi:hypothetical protein